jgi:hypothetical protein
MTLYPLQSLLTPLLSYAILGSGFTSGDAVGGLIIVSALGVCVYVRWRESKLRDAEKAAQQTKALELGVKGLPEDGHPGEVEPYQPVYGHKPPLASSEGDNEPVGGAAGMSSPFPIGNGVAGAMDEMGIADEVKALERGQTTSINSSRDGRRYH